MGTEPRDAGEQHDDSVEPPVEEEEESGDEILAQPFEPKEIRIETRTMSVDLLIEMHKTVPTLRYVNRSHASLTTASELRRWRVAVTLRAYFFCSIVKGRCLQAGR